MLKRLPGVTVGGRPGRGGDIRMRGLGSGYTQILIDGQRMPFGFSLDEVAPEQIERIEIMRAPVAEYGTRAIAGTINVVLREDFKRKSHEVKLGLGSESGRPQASASWLRNGQSAGLGYNLTGTVFRRRQGNETWSRDLGIDAHGATTLDQASHTLSTDEREGIFLTSRLQFKQGGGDSLELQPFVAASKGRSRASAELQQAAGSAPAPYASAAWDTESNHAMARLNGSWLHATGSGGRLQMRLGSVLARNDSLTRREEFGPTGTRSRETVDDGATRDLLLDASGKFSQLIADRHSASAGWELQRGQRSDRRTTLDNGVPTLAEFGADLEAGTLRLAAFAQDEWDWSKTFSFYAGLRWEGIRTASDSALQRVTNLSSVWTPLAHMVWKLPDAPRDQVRLSLTRSYRAPTTAQLIARPSLSSLYPDTARANAPISPDRAGNPALKPELALGLDAAFEHYLDAGGIVSANLFARRIDHLIRTVLAQEVVSWASVPRWVARPQNIGSALATGLELEAKLRAADLWATDLPLALRGNASFFASRVAQVSGPNNRLDQQPGYTANLGFDLPLRGTPLTVGGNLNFTPGFVVQQIDSQAYRQGVKRVLDAYALWRFGPLAQVRLALANAAPRDYDSASTTVLADGSSQTEDTLARTYTTLTLRAELRF